MNRFLSTLCALLITSITAQVSAQEQEFETVMTPAFSPITWERLVNSKEEPHNWLMYSGSLDAQRHSSLDEVNINNVADLELKWAYQIPEIDRAGSLNFFLASICCLTCGEIGCSLSSRSQETIAKKLIIHPKIANRFKSFFR